MFAVVLVHPEIPPNTGNVIRLTANTATALHLVEPLGFRMDDRDLKRAGLDYHEYARVAIHGDWPACRAALEREMDPNACAAPGGGARALGRPCAATSARRYFALTTKAVRSLYDAQFAPGDVFVFGCETAGLPPPIVAEFAPEHQLAIPMRPGVRSLNLSNAVAVTVYEAWRQQRFALAD